ncbi:MAG: Zn-dependent oligopeptidase [Proteobacteria bacterium]|nr:Zn-dependent oligopeptidase [Pseudomonadota bacterium]
MTQRLHFAGLAFGLSLALTAAHAATLSVQPPLWADHPSVERFERGVDEHIARAQQRLEQLRRVDGARTVENTVAPYDEAVRHLNTAVYLANLLQQVHPDARFRDRATSAFVKVSSVQTAISLDPSIYRGLAAVPLGRADQATRHYVERQLLEFRLAGVDKDPATRERLKSLNDELSQQVADFDRNISDDVRHVEVVATDLAGLPPDFLARHPPGPDGKIAITTAYPDLIPVLSFASAASLRRELFTQFLNRGYPKNGPVLARMLALREQIATLVGYHNWADYYAADKMAGSGATVGAFIEAIARTARPGAAREYELLLTEKRHADPAAEAVSPDEKRYYSELVRRSTFDFDSQSVRPYFPYAQVKQGLLDVAAVFFGVQFEREPGVTLWDPAVEAWRVLDHGRLLGRVYLDMHPRPGKFSHAEMVPVLDGVRGRQLPEGILVCNFPQPAAGDPGLMAYDDVQTFFHEFGHLMHHVLGGAQRWAGISGITMESDFVEAPSQMLEELLRSPAVLARFARHYQTGAPIPAELVARMNRAAAFGRAGWLEGQNAYAAISYDLHRVPASAVDPDAVVAADVARLTMLRPLADTHEWAGFGHLAGYSSAYYTYLWDKVIALDFFQQFSAADPLAGDAPARYRRVVLEPGGSASAADLVRGFLGRPQSPEALERWIGAEFASP